jgi:hypothetical protein
MQWHKLGLVYAPDGERAWARTHAMLPTPLLLSEDRLRLYVAHTDENTVARAGYLDIKLSEPTRVLAVADKPVFDIGQPGAFDDNGVGPCCVVAAANTLRVYYSGIQLQRKVPYTLLTGLATGTGPDGPFTRASQAPILDRTDGELFFRTAPFVLREPGRWRMWYVGGSNWIESGNKTFPLYSLRHIESDDGVTWAAPSVECLAPEGPDEIGLGRPFVVHDGRFYRMWYSIRKITGYRIGYATSPDGLCWTRRDREAGIDCSATGWDSEMVCFAAVVPYRGRWLMFYNGNGYGRTGVGVAVSDGD